MIDRAGKDKPLKILIADDSSDNRFLLAAFLKSSNCELVIVEDGQRAFDAFKSNKFDIVLMDMSMPVVNGFDSTRMIRKWESENSQTHIPILALTAYSLPEEIIQCTNAGCDEHISKPVRKKSLIEAIQHLTNNQI